MRKVAKTVLISAMVLFFLNKISAMVLVCHNLFNSLSICCLPPTIQIEGDINVLRSVHEKKKRKLWSNFKKHIVLQILNGRKLVRLSSLAVNWYWKKCSHLPGNDKVARSIELGKIHFHRTWQERALTLCTRLWVHAWHSIIWSVLRWVFLHRLDCELGLISLRVWASYITCLKATNLTASFVSLPLDRTSG